MSVFIAAAALQLLFFPGPPAPDIDLNSIVKIECREGQGSGFVVNETTIATAEHVGLMIDCVDSRTGKALTLSHRDSLRDFALMTGDFEGRQPLRYSCLRYRTGAVYHSLGHRGPQYRMNRLVATATYDTFPLGGRTLNNLRKMQGTVAQGTSGGPVVDEHGYVIGMNNVTNVVTHSEAYSVELADTVLCDLSRR